MQPVSIQRELQLPPHRDTTRYRQSILLRFSLPGLLLSYLILAGCSESKPANLSETNIGDPTDDKSSPSVLLPSDTNFDQLANVEDFEQAASKQLKKIAEWIEQGDNDPTSINALSSPSYHSPKWDMTQLETVRDSVFKIQRIGSSMDLFNATAENDPSASLGAAWQQLLSPLGKPAEKNALARRVKFKISRVLSETDKVETDVIVSVFARHENGTSREINSTLNIQWVRNGQKTLPQIESIIIKDYETAQFNGTSGVTFIDRTGDFIQRDKDLLNQFSHGTEYWTSRLMQGDYSGHFGLAVGDINGDQLDDIYVCQPAGLPNRLLVQQPNGQVKDLSKKSGLDILDQTRSALFADLDNDGDQDLLVAAASFLLVYENQGGTELKLRDKLFEARSAYSLSAADFDQDGDLDIYACGYNPLFGAGQFPFAYPFHDANNGGRNVLYQNDGQGNFQDVTDSVGLNENNTRFSMAAAWEDFDIDGDLDLYVANDFGRNTLYENQGGQFQNVAGPRKVEDQSFGMSVDWADVNHDGLPDLYVSNMFSSAGNRVSFQSGFMSRQPKLQSRVQYMARGNSLFLGATDSFIDASMDSNAWMGRWAWSSKLVDLDNDSWDDVVVANGYLTRKLPDDL